MYYYHTDRARWFRHWYTCFYVDSIIHSSVNTDFHDGQLFSPNSHPLTHLPLGLLASHLQRLANFNMLYTFEPNLTAQLATNSIINFGKDCANEATTGTFEVALITVYIAVSGMMTA